MLFRIVIALSVIIIFMQLNVQALFTSYEYHINYAYVTFDNEIIHLTTIERKSFGMKGK